MGADAFFIVLGLEVLFDTEREPWPSLNPIIAAIVGGIFLLIFILFLIVKHYYRIKDKKLKAHQLFLFSCRKKELTNYQYKILKGLVDIININDPNIIFRDQSLYESSIGSFLSYLSKSSHDTETLLSICRDIIIIHEKLYNPSPYRKPIRSIEEIDEGSLVALFSESNDVCIAKVISIREGIISMKFFRNEEIPSSFLNKTATLYLWRSGDAEYTTTLRDIQVVGNTIVARAPSLLTRGKEVRFPYLEVMIPCQIKIINTSPKHDENEELTKQIELPGTIYRLNEYEAVARIGEKVDYGKNYIIRFTIYDFNVAFESKIIGEKFIHDQNEYYVTFRFLEGSEAAHNVLKQYLSDHRGEM
ncbi:MAG: hypothetical protein N2316_12725 [Spirochaetes bacterium]|nr:hypothetical protein [Spirochaetota bacterium]